MLIVNAYRQLGGWVFGLEGSRLVVGLARKRGGGHCGVPGFWGESGGTHHELPFSTSQSLDTSGFIQDVQREIQKENEHRFCVGLRVTRQDRKKS